MSGLPWYPRFTGDYSRKTSHLTMLEHGAYNLLLDHYYATGKPLLFSNATSNATSNAELMPDHSRIYRLCGAITKQEQEAVDNVLKTFFEWNKKLGYINKKADEVIEKQGYSRERRVNAGRKGGLSNATSNAKAMLKQCQRNPEPEPESKDSFSRYRIEIFLKDDEWDALRRDFRGWDIQNFASEFNTFIVKKQERPAHPYEAFRGFIAKVTKGKTP